MADLRKLVKEILEKGYLLSLGTVDENGVWVSDVIYLFDEQFNLYWISDTATRHSRAILKNPRVAGTITVSNNKEEPNVGLQISGTARRMRGPHFKLSIAHRKKRGKPLPFKDILEGGESWYMFMPDKIEIIYEPLFGFDKKTLQPRN